MAMHGFVLNVLLLALLLQALTYSASQPGPGPDDSDDRFGRGAPQITLIMFLGLISLFAAGFFFMYVRECLDQQWRSRNGSVVAGQSRSAHGLETEVIESFPIFLYSMVRGPKIGKNPLECAVCLNEFEDNQVLRLIPHCNHVFHHECIDAWLQHHTTCPVCRADLVPEPGANFSLQVEALRPNSSSPENSRGERRVLGSQGVNLISSSMSTGCSAWLINSRWLPRSNSTGHTVVRPVENLERFTLRLSEEVRNQLVQSAGMNRSKSEAALPQPRSPGTAYRSGSLGSGTCHDRFDGTAASLSENRRPVFTIASSLQSPGRDDTNHPEDAGPSRGVLKTIKSPFAKILGKDDGSDRQPKRLCPDCRV